MFLINVIESMGFIGLLYIAITLVVAITVHEFAHAAVANWLGDPTPASQGRVTLNPLSHLDPFGSLLFLAAGFGWGRPVMTQPAYYRNGPRAGGVMVAIAGPLSNLLMAFLAAIVYRGLALMDPMREVTLFFYLFVNLNVLLFFFNLIPLPPLDGYRVLQGILPPDLAYAYSKIEPFGFLIFIALVVVGGGVLNLLIYTPTATLTRLLIGL